MLAADMDLTEMILTSALDEKRGESFLKNFLAAESDGKTAFDLLCPGLENAAFHNRGHVLNKFFRDAWLFPLRFQSGRQGWTGI